MDRKPKARQEFATRERCFITEFVNDPAVPDVSLALCRVEPGVTTELHALSVCEWYTIDRGHGRMHIGGREPFPVGPGDVVHIPSGAAQQISNTGPEDLLFKCICVPRFTPGCYTPLE